MWASDSHEHPLTCLDTLEEPIASHMARLDGLYLELTPRLSVAVLELIGPDRYSFLLDQSKD